MKHIKRLSRNHLLVLESIIQADLKQIFCPVSIDDDYETAHPFSLQVTKSIRRIAYMEITKYPKVTRYVEGTCKYFRSRIHNTMSQSIFIFISYPIPVSDSNKDYCHCYPPLLQVLSLKT